MGYTTLELVPRGPVVTVRLHREATRNAFDDIMIAELTRAFRELGADDSVRVIELAASGPTFCAGADLNWMKRTAGYEPDENHAEARRMADMLHAVYICPKPVVAAVQGDCHGGGVGLVCAADIAIGARGAEFSFAEVKLGLIPATISPYVLRTIGERMARRYFLTAEKFDAAEAYRIGLLHEVVEPEELRAKTDQILAALATSGRNAIAAGKELIRDIAGRDIDEALLEDTAGRIARIRASEEAREGLQLFLQRKRLR